MAVNSELTNRDNMSQQIDVQGSKPAPLTLQLTMPPIVWFDLITQIDLLDDDKDAALKKLGRDLQQFLGW